jgi:hypothetical protein
MGNLPKIDAAKVDFNTQRSGIAIAFVVESEIRSTYG